MKSEDNFVVIMLMKINKYQFYNLWIDPTRAWTQIYHTQGERTQIYHTQGEHANYCTTDAVVTKLKEQMIIHLSSYYIFRIRVFLLYGIILAELIWTAKNFTLCYRIHGDDIAKFEITDFH